MTANARPARKKSFEVVTVTDKPDANGTLQHIGGSKPMKGTMSLLITSANAFGSKIQRLKCALDKLAQ